MLSRTPRTVLGVLVGRVPAAFSADGSCPWSGYAGAVFLVPVAIGSGLGDPMPASIALVLAGRCRPSPDPMAEGAPADRHRGRVMAAYVAMTSGEGLSPVLGTPYRGVGGINGDHADTGLRAHADQSCAESAGGNARDELPDFLLPAVFLTGCGVGEVEVFDRDGPHVGVLGPVQKPGQGVAELGVTMVGGAGQRVVEAARGAHWGYRARPAATRPGGRRWCPRRSRPQPAARPRG